MALITRYVNPGADGTGDGTTPGLTGADSAYQSLAAWDLAEATDLVAAGDSHKVLCAGGQDVGGFLDLNTDWGTNHGANTLTIEADRGQTDGFNDTQLFWDESFYWLENTAPVDFQILVRVDCIIDGLQMYQFFFGANRGGIRIFSGKAVVRNCRIRSVGSGPTAGGIWTENTAEMDVSNNLISKFDIGIHAKLQGSGTYTHSIYNNTIWLSGADGIKLAVDRADVTFNIRNNALFSNVTDMTVGTVSPTTRDYNAGQDDPPTGDPNSRTFSPTLTDDMVDPEAAEGSENVFPVSSGTLDGTGIADGTAPTTDLLGTSRASPPCIGAFDLGGVAPTFQAAWASQSNGVILP